MHARAMACRAALILDSSVSVAWCCFLVSSSCVCTVRAGSAFSGEEAGGRAGRSSRAAARVVSGVAPGVTRQQTA